MIGTLDPPNTYKLRGYNGPAEQEDIKGHVKNKLANEKTTKRTIDWSVGDFDPRDCIVLWSYESGKLRKSVWNALIILNKNFIVNCRGANYCG